MESLTHRMTIDTAERFTKIVAFGTILSVIRIILAMYAKRKEVSHADSESPFTVFKISQNVFLNLFNNHSI